MQAWLGHNLGLKLLSLLLAILLWALVVGEQKVDVIMSAPLQLNLPENLALVSEAPEGLEIHLRGPRTLVTTLTRRDVAPAVLPARYSEGENIIQVRPEAIRVPRGIQVVDVTPRRIRLLLEPVIEREVEVQPRVEGRLPEGLVVRRVAATPPRVRLVGPASEIRRLTRVATMPVPLDGRHDSFSTQTALEYTGRQVRVLDDTVTVQVDIAAKRS
jgi:YbbR domain-containing protein